MGQWPIFHLMAIEYVWEFSEKSLKILHCDWDFLNWNKINNKIKKNNTNCLTLLKMKYSLWMAGHLIDTKH